jgi:hypothetical protein
MISRFLLHDPSDMSIGGVSDERKLSIWGRVLEWHCRRQEAFCNLKCLLSGSGPLQRFGPSLQEISQRFQNFSTVGQKAAAKVYHAEKTLQLFDNLRGWSVFDFGGVIESKRGRVKGGEREGESHGGKPEEKARG